jgi:hypothetical protein
LFFLSNGSTEIATIGLAAPTALAYIEDLITVATGNFFEKGEV